MQSQNSNVEPLSFIQFARINGKVVRFYAPPEMPDFPWASWSDLFVAAGFPRKSRKLVAEKLVRDWGSSLRTVETDTGETYVVPHSMCQGLTRAAIDAGYARPSLEDSYLDASSEAMEAMLANLPALEQVSFAFAALARKD